MKKITVVLALCLAACSKDPVSPVSVAGSWFGTEIAVIPPKATLSMTLTAQGSVVTGTGTLDGSAVAISGSFKATTAGDPATAMLTLSANGKATVTYTVTYIGSNSMAGQLYGGRYNGNVLHVDRQ